MDKTRDPMQNAFKCFLLWGEGKNKNMIGVASSESITSADLGALVSAFGKCQIPSFKVGTRKVLRKRKSQVGSSCLKMSQELNG